MTKQYTKKNFDTLVSVVEDSCEMLLEMENDMIMDEVSSSQHLIETTNTKELRQVSCMLMHKADILEAMDICKKHKNEPIVNKIRADLNNEEVFKFTNASKPLSIHNDEKVVSKIYDIHNKPGKKTN